MLPERRRQHPGSIIKTPKPTASLIVLPILGIRSLTNSCKPQASSPFKLDLTNSGINKKLVLIMQQNFIYKRFFKKRPGQRHLHVVRWSRDNHRRRTSYIKDSLKKDLGKGIYMLYAGLVITTDGEIYISRASWRG